MKRNRLLISCALALVVLALVTSTDVPSRVDAANFLPSSPPQTVPVFELFNSSSGYHLYTANKEAKDKLISKGEFQLIKIAYNVFQTQVPGTVKFHSLVDIITVKWANGSVRDSERHLYTTSTDEFTNLQKYGWHDLGFVGYIAPNQLPGTVKLYRLVHPEDFSPDPDASVYYPPAGSNDNYYTTDLNEMNYLVQNGWQLVHTEGYVWQEPTTLGEPAPPALPESYYKEQLSDLGCNPVLGLPNQITCTSKAGYFDCEFYRKEGKIKVTACIANFDLAGFNAIESTLVKLGCKRFVGRPGEYLCEDWNGGDYCDDAITKYKGLITKCYTPRKNLVLSYQNSFGRNPANQEIAYWEKQYKAQPISYKDLMKTHHQWLQTEAANGERKGLVNRSYYEVIGRYPTTDEINYWIDNRLKPEGMNYEELRKAQIDWVMSVKTELHEMVKRAFVAVNNIQPNEAQIQSWMAKASAQKLSFKNLVILMKSQQFPKGG